MEHSRLAKASVENIIISTTTSIYSVFASAVFYLCPHINSLNQGMPVHLSALKKVKSFASKV